MKIIAKIMDCRKRNVSGLEKLFNQIFAIDEYTSLVRPSSLDSLTRVETELKLLQIDLVSLVI